MQKVSLFAVGLLVFACTAPGARDHSGSPQTPEPAAGAAAHGGGSGGEGDASMQVRSGPPRDASRPKDAGVPDAAEESRLRDAADGGADAAERMGDIQSPVDAGVCPVVAEAPPRECTRDDECATFLLRACCGSDTVTGIRADAAELSGSVDRCRCSTLGCIGGPVITDDGMPITAAGYAVSCELGRCRTRSLEPTFACGATTCALRTHYCFAVAGGVPDAGINYSCLPRSPNCSECACLAGAASGCQCRQAPSGELHVLCAAP